MADEEIKDEVSKDKEAASDNKSGLVGWIITFAVAIVCSAGGYGLSGLFAKAAPAKSDETANSENTDETNDLITEDLEGSKPWQFELQPITANLNEPGATRMIQVTVVMELSAEMDETKGREFLDGKIIHLRDWLQTYLANLNLEQVKGGHNQSRMKVEIRESFNEELFPDSKPLVQRVMLKDFIIQ